MFSFSSVLKAGGILVDGFPLRWKRKTADQHSTATNRQG